MGHQVGCCFPLFDDDKRVVAIGRERAETRCINVRGIFDATLLRMNRGYVRLECAEDSLALPCFALISTTT